MGKSAEEYAEKQLQNGINYFQFCTEWIHKGWTPLFEFCSRRWVKKGTYTTADTLHSHPILLDYPKDRLVLIALRNMATGQYMSHSELLQEANVGECNFVFHTHQFKKYSVPTVNCWQGTASNFNDLLNQVPNASIFWIPNRAKIRQTNGLEGYVLRSEDGQMVKVKTLFYYNLSRGLSVESNANSEKYLWKTILENKWFHFRLCPLSNQLRYDDAKSFIAVDERPALDKFAADLIERLCFMRAII